MWVVKRARHPYPDRWPTKPELVRDVLRSPLMVGACGFACGIGFGITALLGTMGAAHAWQPLVFALAIVGVLVGGVRFVLEAFYEQEVKPHAEDNERTYGRS